MKVYNQYIKEGYSYRQLSDQTKHNKKSLQKYVRNKIDSSYITDIDNIYENVSYVLIDGTYIKNICAIIYYEYKLKKILKITIAKEESLSQIICDLEELNLVNKYNIKSFTIDGGIQIIGAIKKVYENSTIQRCLIHINRQIRNYIGKNTKNGCGRELLFITTFKVIRNKDSFDKLFDEWLIKRNNYLAEKTYGSKDTKRKRRYTHRRLRQSRSHLLNARQYMFQNLIDENIVDNTNELEGLISLLKTEIHNHRGMEIERLKKFIIQRCYNRN